MGASGLIGSVGSVFGFESAETKAAGAAMDASLAQSRYVFEQNQKTSKEMIEFNQGQLDRWEETFGGLEQNLNNYYSNLDPAKFAQRTKTTLAEQMNKQLSQFTDKMAATGLLTSGMRAQAEKESAFKLAESNASIDMAAPDQVAQMQQQWLSGNKATEQNAIAGINSAYGARMGVTTNNGNAIAGQYQQQANMYAQSAQGYNQLLGGIIGAGAAMYAGAGETD